MLDAKADIGAKEFAGFFFELCEGVVRFAGKCEQRDGIVYQAAAIIQPKNIVGKLAEAVSPEKEKYITVVKGQIGQAAVFVKEAFDSFQGAVQIFAVVQVNQGNEQERILCAFPEVLDIFLRSRRGRVFRHILEGKQDLLVREMRLAGGVHFRKACLVCGQENGIVRRFDLIDFDRVVKAEGVIHLGVQRLGKAVFLWISGIQVYGARINLRHRFSSST